MTTATSSSMVSYPDPGSIVACRDRTWVVLPSANPDIIRLRPLSGNEEQICGIFTPLELEPITPAQFPPPEAQDIQDHTAAKLLLNAARLSLRSGAGPFRCLGRLSVRPRPYQLVPLLMALRLETVRLLIADDVGIGKTIEAGLIARELLDRNEIKRIAVLCPPQLCDQWQRELKQKFHIDAVVVRSGTVSKLERGLPSGDSHIFSYYPHLIVSLDYAKSDRRRASFLTHCPDLVIVDEAHTCSNRNNTGSTQQRHQLVQKIAARPNRHLVLLTATPHSGIESSFLSLLGLLNPDFEQLAIDSLTEQERKDLARHFIQRRRADVQHWLGNTTPFPQRNALEAAYTLSKDYRELFEQVYDFARGLVRSADSSLSYAQRRGRYWSALAIIRCVMSSPAAAVTTLSRQIRKRETALTDQESEDLSILDEDFATYVYDPTEQEQAVDIVPSVVVEQGQQSYKDSEKRKLRAFVKAAETLYGKKDNKLQSTLKLVQELLQEGYNPIIWCRYIATANYVAKELREILEKKKGGQTRVIAITGEQSEDEREIRLQELTDYPQRVMVATDCLSEGVNLQDYFTAVLHYDLPWNPNRLEQREGRIDRYGQAAEQVKCLLLYGEDNPVDGSVLEVLLRKAVKIHRSLGITVPVPMDSNTVQEAVFQSLFEQATEVRQLSLLELLEDNTSPVAEVHASWDRAVEKEKQNRTRFAQRAIKSEDVEQELIESEEILGSEQDVAQFVQSACGRLNASLVKKKQGWYLPHIPYCVQAVLGNEPRLITFTTPAPEGVEYIGRNHPLVEGLARHLLEGALEGLSDPVAARCGFTVTDAVSKPTVILLFRLRHLLDSPRHQALLAEECLVRGFTGSPSTPDWLTPEDTLTLLENVAPVADFPIERKRMTLDRLLGRLGDLEEELGEIAEMRSRHLAQSHARVRAITQEGKVQVKPHLPMDILGIYYLVNP
ncbi:helicase-related protein [Spirulina sp. CS-785/01]|uniref:helicase-related protein n=1 Tax=Spirulina sp. CS-785/01 TaxID=3021716 RepID=UPI00232F00EA|nr:helicase-related protein [Spirulina sp. CS-785/01]MDB9312225.1 helicase-related protein [Spirulina sp. CS-785/01]